jgi:hypothetical protein
MSVWTFLSFNFERREDALFSASEIVVDLVHGLNFPSSMEIETLIDSF